MFEIFVTVTAISLALLYSVTSLLKKDRSLATFVLSAALIITVVVEISDWFARNFHDNFYFWKQISLIAEAAMAPAWLCYSLVFSREQKLSSVPLIQKIIFPVTLSLIGFALFLPGRQFFNPDIGSEQIMFLASSGFYFYFGVMVTLVLALINLEATFTGAPSVSRWKIRLEVVGTGGLLSVLIYYYIHGFLFRNLDLKVSQAVAVALIVAVILITASQMRGGVGIKVVLSQQLAYRSFVLLSIGLYLIFIGLMGEGLKYFGESFQRSALVMIAFLAAIGLFLFILSDKAKRRFTLFISRNIYQNKYDYRSQWLEFTERLSSAHTNQDILMVILSVYCDTFGMRSAGLFLRDGERKRYLQAAAMELDLEGQTFAVDDPLIKNLVAERKVINLCQGYAEAGADVPEYFRAKGICFVIPLVSSKLLDGFIVLGARINEGEQYGYEDYDLMQTLAQQASSTLLNMRLTDELAQAKEMELLGRIATFIIHDLKNLVYTISLTVDNARTYISDTEFQQDMLETLSNTVNKMNALISRLNTIPDKKGLPPEPTDLLQLARETVALVKRGRIDVNGVPVCSLVDRQEIQKVILNLILNAVEATEGAGPVTVEVGDGESPHVKVSDGGCGISEEFIRTKLFSPFQTTKKGGLGIGLYQCRQIVESHDGRIDVHSALGAGTTFTVWLPFCPSAPDDSAAGVS